MIKIGDLEIFPIRGLINCFLHPEKVAMNTDISKITRRYRQVHFSTESIANQDRKKREVFIFFVENSEYVRLQVYAQGSFYTITLTGEKAEEVTAIVKSRS